MTQATARQLSMELWDFHRQGAGLSVILSSPAHRGIYSKVKTLVGLTGSLVHVKDTLKTELSKDLTEGNLFVKRLKAMVVYYEEALTKAEKSLYGKF